jgi:DNA polymerase-3 subunit alpha
VEDFVKRKHGLVPVDYPFDVLKPILQDTYGIIVYQEQVQKIASVLANYSLGEADLLRRAMGKKDKNEMKKQKSRFISGAEANGYDANRAGDVFDLMEKFAEYGFNKSHSAAYGWVTYQTAWLKTYYPTEFMAATMSCDLGNTDKISIYMNDCRRMKINILPPCVNNSKYKFSVPEKNTIQFGLGAIKGLGAGIINEIIEERNLFGCFSSVQEFMIRIYTSKISKKVIECLVKSGAFDSLCPNRREIFENSDQWLKIISKEISRGGKKSIGIFDLVDNSESVNRVKNIMPSLQTKILKDWNFLEKLSYEYAQIGTYMTGHPADIFRQDLNYLSTTRLCDIYLHLEPEEVKDYQRKVVRICGIVSFLFEKKNKNNEPFLVFKIEDGTDEFECVLFHKQYIALSFKLQKGDAVYIECKLKKGVEEETARGVVQSITTIENKRLEYIKNIVLDTNENFLQHKENIIELQKILSRFKGKTPVFINSILQQDKMNLRARLDSLDVMPNDAFLFEMKNQWNKDVFVKHVYENKI